MTLINVTSHDIFIDAITNNIRIAITINDAHVITTCISIDDALRAQCDDVELKFDVVSL